MATEARTANTTRDGTDFCAAVNDAMVGIGERFGLYAALASTGPVTAAEVARRTGIPERDATFWLAAQAAEDYLEFDETSGRYSLWSEWPRSN